MPRLIAYPLLVVAGILSLPVAATFLDDAALGFLARQGLADARA